MPKPLKLIKNLVNSSAMRTGSAKAQKGFVVGILGQLSDLAWDHPVGLMLVVRLLVLVGISLRFAFHWKEVSHSSAHGIEVQSFVILAFLLYSAVILGSLVAKRETLTNTASRVMIGVECVAIWLAYTVTGQPESDFFLFLFVPLLDVVIRKDWPSVLYANYATQAALLASIMGSFHFATIQSQMDEFGFLAQKVDINEHLKLAAVRIYAPRLLALAIGGFFIVALARKAKEIADNEESIEGFQTLADIVPTPIFCKWTDGRFWFGNLAFRKQFGREMSLEELQSKVDSDLFPIDDAKLYRTDDAKVIESGKEITRREPFRPLNSSVKLTIRVTKAPILIGGKILGIVGFFVDETSQVRTEDEVNKMLDDARKTLTAKSFRGSLALLGGFFAHDIRHPIGAIRLVNALVKANFNAHKEAAQIERHAQRAVELIDGFLARAEGKFRFEQHDIIRCVNQAKATCWPKLKARNIQLTVDSSVQSGGRIECDSFVIVQLFANLFENAVKHLPESGGNVKVSLSGKDNDVVLYIEDDGPGFPPEVIESQGRFQPDEDNKTRGMGLVIVKNIAQIHGGSVVLQNREGAGALVRVFLKREISARKKKHLI